MRNEQLSLYPKRTVDAWLTISVHFDAFRSEPLAYLSAVKSMLLGKRVRSRSQFAALLSKSPRAYSWWASRQVRGPSEPKAVESQEVIIALVDVRGGNSAKAVDITLESLAAEQIPALMLGSEETPTLLHVLEQVDWSTKPWLLPMATGDRVLRGSAAAYKAAMDDPAIRLIYADDDLLAGNIRYAPHFKPDWNAELFRHHDYISGACVLRAERSDFETLLEAPDSAEKDWAALLTARLALSGRPRHVRQMLHHRGKRPAVRLPATALVGVRHLPPISVIVPTRNRVDLLRTCLSGLAATDYPDLEVLVMDNDSDDPETLDYLSSLDSARHRVLRHGGEFNYSAINNRAAQEAQSRLLCLLNNDVEITQPEWLVTLATQALRPEVGAVGARLLYPDGRIQHAGVVIGVGNAAGHAHRFLAPEAEGYFHRHSLPQFAMAVTAACMVVERDKFFAAGALDEANFPVAFNDVDLCLRLNKKGWQSFYEPRATLIHHESLSRGLDKDPLSASRLASELSTLKRIWRTDEIVDPFHHPQLSRESEQFVFSI